MRAGARISLPEGRIDYKRLRKINLDAAADLVSRGNPAIVIGWPEPVVLVTRPFLMTRRSTYSALFKGSNGSFNIYTD